MSAVTTSRARPNPWLILLLVAIPVFIGSLDLTIVSAFLPEIIVQLELPIQNVIDDAAWVVTGYLLAYTVSMTFMGRLSDIIGRRRTYFACLVIFLIGSFIVAEVDPQARSGIAGWLYNAAFRITGERPDAGGIALITIIIGRIVQALGAGALVPVSLALVGDMFPREKRAQPLGIIGAIDTLGWVLGHLYGGIMVNFFAANALGFENLFASLGLNWDVPDWRWLFWINIPVTLIAIVVTAFALRGVKHERSKARFDLLGALLIAGSITCLVLGLGANIEISSSASSFTDLGGLPPYAAPLLAAAAVMFAAFVFVELRHPYPLFDLRRIVRGSTGRGSLVNLLVGFCLMIGLVSVPILVNIRVADATNLSAAALQVGILLSAFTVPMALAAIPGGWLAARVGYGRAASIGLGLALIGFLLIWRTWTLDMSDALVAVQMAIVGIGIGLTFSPISAAVINDAEDDRLGASSALVIIMRLLGMTISISLLTALASQRLGILAAAELGAEVVDPFAAIDVYSRLTVQVLGEINLVGAIICIVALIPAWRLGKRIVSGGG
ncbi:MAG: MFS transporter [Pleurocapsa minor GSE-CHR-MK-17-07R]|jgi:MFS family permease|nr:MFS transporter [Pleurocapsa minor GSE-CHR-MK 17-07R]